MSTGMTLLYLAVGLTVAAAIVYRVLMFRASVDAGFRTTLHERVERVLAPHEGQPVSETVLAALKRDVDLAIRDGLVEYGRPESDFTVLLRNDDVLGPVCFVRTSDGRELALSAFERELLARPHRDAA